jgi:hypothetical protein
MNTIRKEEEAAVEKEAGEEAEEMEAEEEKEEEKEKQEEAEEACRHGARQGIAWRCRLPSCQAPPFPTQPPSSHRSSRPRPRAEAGA